MIRNGPSGCVMRISKSPSPSARDRGNRNWLPSVASRSSAAYTFAFAGTESPPRKALIGRAPRGPR